MRRKLMLAAAVLLLPATAWAAFTVFGPAPAGTLDSVTVYPNPFRPDDGVAENGIPYAAGNPNSGVIFANLSAQVSIEVFAADGRRVAQLQPGNASRNLQWDASDADGSPLAAGLYIWVIRDGGNRVRTGRLHIIR